METKIITGTAIEVEQKINEYHKAHDVTICGFSATDNTCTIVIQICPLPI